MEHLYVIAIALIMLGCGINAIGEAKVVTKALDNMGRNPEMYSNIRSTMILGCSLVESTAIYSLIIAILLLFIH